MLFIDAETAEFPALREQLSVSGNVVLAVSEDNLEGTSHVETDLYVIARQEWTDRTIEVCRRLRVAGRAAPILGLSGPCDPQQRALAVRAGADEFLSMPFDADDVATRGQSLVRRGSSRAGYARVGPFAVDLWRREVFVEDRALSLTPREYDMFVMLVERSGEVVTRQDLAARIAKGAQAGESNVVDVHMSRIRDKLGPHASQVETVRGKGYRLRAP